jgi:hypothetical protein
MKDSESDGLDPQLRFHVDWNLPNHRPVNELTTETRFNHLQGMEIGTGLRVPVEVNTTVAMSGLDEQGDPGQPIHTGGNTVEFTELEPVDIQEEVERIDFQELLHDDRVYPDRPESWPLEDPYSIIPGDSLQFKS